MFFSTVLDEIGCELQLLRLGGTTDIDYNNTIHTFNGHKCNKLPFFVFSNECFMKHLKTQ